MMKNRKRNTVFMTIILSVFLLPAGCTDRNVSVNTSSALSVPDTEIVTSATDEAVAEEVLPETEEVIPPADPVTVTLLHDLDEEHEEILQGLTDAFNTSNTQAITVRLIRSAEGLEDLERKLTANSQEQMPEQEQMPGQEPEGEENPAQGNPDLLIADSLLPAVANETSSSTVKLQPLNQFLRDNPENYEQYRKILFDASSKVGTVYGLPFAVQTDLIFYNKSVLAESQTSLPTDANSFQTAAEKVMNNRHIPLLGVCVGTAAETAFFDDVLSAFGATLTTGGTMTEGLSDSVQIGFDTVHGEAAVSFLLKMFREGYIRTYEDPDRMRQDYLRAAIGGYVGTSGDLTYMNAERFETAPALVSLAKQKTGALSMKDIFLLTADEKKAGAAMSFLKYLTGEDITTLWAVGTGDIPVSEAAFDFKEYRSLTETDDVSRLLADRDTMYFFADRSEGAVYIRDLLRSRLVMHAGDDVTPRDLIEEISTILVRDATGNE